MISDFNETLQLYTEEELRLDLGCKRVLSDKYILGYILEECAEEFRGHDIRDIAQVFIEQTPLKLYSDTSSKPPRIQGLNPENSAAGGKIIGDLFFSATIPEPITVDEALIDIEPQGDFHPGYPLPKREFFNGAMKIVSQLGTKFTGSNYGQMCRVYTIWIFLNPPKYAQNSLEILNYEKHLVEGNGMRTSPADYDNLRIVNICLGDRDKAKSKVLKLLDTIFAVDITAEMKCRILVEDFGIPISDDLEGAVIKVGNICASYVEKGRVEGITEGITKGRIEGRAEGITKGRAEGITEGKVSLIRHFMKASKSTAEQALTALFIPDEERTKYLKLLSEEV